MSTELQQAVEETVLRHKLLRKTEAERLALRNAKLRHKFISINRKDILNINREQVAKIIINHRVPDWWKFKNITLKDSCTVKIMK